MDIVEGDAKDARPQIIPSATAVFAHLPVRAGWQQRKCLVHRRQQGP